MHLFVGLVWLAQITVLKCWNRRDNVNNVSYIREQVSVDDKLKSESNILNPPATPGFQRGRPEIRGATS